MASLVAYLLNGPWAGLIVNLLLSHVCLRDARIYELVVNCTVSAERLHCSADYQNRLSSSGNVFVQNHENHG